MVLLRWLIMLMGYWGIQAIQINKREGVQLIALLVIIWKSTFKAYNPLKLPLICFQKNWMCSTECLEKYLKALILFSKQYNTSLDKSWNWTYEHKTI